MNDDASRASATGRVVDMRQVFPASREVLFRAWSDPRELAKWWGPVGWAVLECEVDLRAGGRWRTRLARPERPPVSVGGTYLEVAPPERLAFTWEPEPRGADGASIVSLEFRAHDGGTEILLSHRKLSSAGKVDMDVGWARTFDSLAAYCRAASGIANQGGQR